MRKLLICVMCALLSLSALSKENMPDFRRNDLSFTYGVYTMPTIAMGVAGVFGAGLAGAVSGGEVTLEDISSSGAFSLQYYRMFRSWFGVGGEAVYERCSLAYTGQNRNVTSFLSVMPSVKFYYFRKPAFAMHFRGSAGALLSGSLFRSGEDSGPDAGLSFAAHMVPAGFSFGAGSLKALAELGLGMGPLVCLGLQYSF